MVRVMIATTLGVVELVAMAVIAVVVLLPRWQKLWQHWQLKQ